MDMPAIHPDYLYKKYCYIYGLAPKIDDVNLGRNLMGRHDLCNPGNDKAWTLVNHYGSEPIFIPDPNGTQEDDGVLLAVMLDGEQEKSYLAIFDARTMEIINRSYLPFHLPAHLHGNFFPEV